MVTDALSMHSSPVPPTRDTATRATAPPARAAAPPFAALLARSDLAAGAGDGAGEAQDGEREQDDGAIAPVTDPASIPEPASALAVMPASALGSGREATTGAAAATPPSADRDAGSTSPAPAPGGDGLPRPAPSAKVPVAVMATIDASLSAEPTLLLAAAASPAPGPSDHAAPAAARADAGAIAPAAAGVRGRASVPARTRSSGHVAAAKPVALFDPTASAPAIGGDLRPLLAQRDAAPPLVSQPAAIDTAHDFGAIVDRLVEARQAGSSIATGATIVHPEFGHVRLRLNQGQDGLAIGLSSADPGFAPVAEAAIRGIAPAANDASRASSPISSQVSETSAQSALAQSSSTQSRDGGGEARRQAETARPFAPPDHPRPVGAAAPDRRSPPTDATVGAGVYA